MKKLGSILLIDDSEADNFIHCRRLDKMHVAGEIVVRNNGRQGLDYLTTHNADGNFPRPDLVFLDINMPVLDGWGFLDAYHQLPEACRARVLIVMLTSSVGDSDYARAGEYALIDAHESKPLTKEKIRGLMEQHFSGSRPI
ncbi:CheY-like chemotaxis protein [Lewinella aquimaris]|uniref:CheY-like chemotaxis protein n=1 Tax=Neolewinella aquimaris TaxID=1835722 RepID=A0A840EC18_9BACT|nr:response regulator [Neolewinella aquimaris]MBB4081055.1 CheY-like chemotaxis protein [Neolewinella aquimaris]